MAGAEKLWRGADRVALWLDRERNAWLVMGAGMAVFAFLAMYLTRGTTVFLDEGNLFSVSRGYDLTSLLSPLNGHFVFMVRLLYATVFKLWNADFVVLRLADVVGACLAASLLFVLVKRRLGPAVALAPALLLLFLGATWEVTFIVSGLTHVWSLSFGLGALIALERRDLRGDVAAAILLLLSVSTFSLGLAFTVGAAVLVLLQPGSRRRLLVCALPAVVYAAWYVWLRTSYVPDHEQVSIVHLYNVFVVPNYIANEIATVAGVVSGTDYPFQHQLFDVFGSTSPYGPVLAVLAAGALLYRMRRPVPPMVWAGIAVLVTFWTGLALATQEGRTPESVRYVYASAAVCFLIAATCLAGRRVATKWLVVLFAVTALAMFGNLARLREGTNFFRDFATTFRVKLTAIEVARGVVPPNFQVAPLPSLRAGAYLASVERNGSPAYTQSGLAEQPEPKRETADQELAAAEGLALTPAPPGPPKGCRPIAAGAPIRPPGVVLRSESPASILLARFADTPTAPVTGTLQPGRPAALRIPADASSLPWRLGTNPPDARLLACRLPGG